MLLVRICLWPRTVVWLAAEVSVLRFWISNLFRISTFGFGILDLGFPV